MTTREDGRAGEPRHGMAATAFGAIGVAFSMFSVIPMPPVPWTKATMRLALAAFPLVGVVIGLLAWAWCAVGGALALPRPLFAAVLVALPVLVTGGIHLDGFMDVSDARASHAGRERMLEIMADPHIGSFAVIRVAVYLLLYFGAACALEPTPATAAGLGSLYVLCRAASGSALALFPIAKDSGLARTFADASSRAAVVAVDAAFCIAAGTVAVRALGLAGLAVPAAVLVVLIWYRYLSARLVGGVTGDFAGWFLQVAELAGIFALVACGALAPLVP